MVLFTVKFNLKNIREAGIHKRHLQRRFQILVVEIGEKDGLQLQMRDCFIR